MKKRFLYPVVLLLVFCGFVSVHAAGDDKENLFDFIGARQGIQYEKVPRKVLAFYYTWYGRPDRHGQWVHWSDVRPKDHTIATSTNYPSEGAYDSHDPALIDRHIDWAKACGIDGFICTWWGQNTIDDRALKIVLDRAKAKGFSVTVYWEIVPGKGPGKIDRAVSDLLYVLKTYGGHPAFLKVGGKPVVFVYGRVMSQVDLPEWQAIIRRTDEKYSKGFLLVADGLSGMNARVFDGIHTYNICGWVEGKEDEALRSFSRASFEGAVDLAKTRKKISCLTVIPGYDDTKIRTPGIDAARNDGATYRVLWEEALRADPDWVLITSWNEWHEGSEIEPSYEYGDQYLQITGEYAARFKETPFSRVEGGVKGPVLSPDKADELRGLYRGKKVGVLPGFGWEGVLWLAEQDIDLEVLCWENVLDPKRFNARALPMVIYTGHEEYVQTVHTPRDVDRSIIRYLEEGGLLVSLARGPFPFYYNEKGEAVSSAGKFGFPIIGSGIEEGSTVGGFETPPDGEALLFTLDTQALGGLSKSAPFPTTGDPRWRPSTGRLLDKGDVYRSLAELNGKTGVSYGDGIAYIEHRVTPPIGGKNLYVWMGMERAVKGHDFYYAIFHFAGKKMGR